MNFENDPIADKTAQHMTELKEKMQIELAGANYNRVFEKIYSILKADGGIGRTLLEHEAKRIAWSLKTFKHATAKSSLLKAKSELKEVEKDMAKNKPQLEEFVDVVMCVMDSMQRAGFTMEEFVKAYGEKNQVNFNRKWKMNPDYSYSHVKK